MSIADTSGMYTRREAAHLAKINPRTLDKLIDAGDIPAVRFGRSVRIPKSFIDQLCTAQQPPSGGDDTDVWVERVLATAPRLSEDQRSKLAELLKPVRTQAEVKPDDRPAKAGRADARRASRVATAGEAGNRSP